MTILHITYTELADCREPRSTARKECIDLERRDGEEMSYSQLVDLVAARMDISRSDFYCEVQAQGLQDDIDHLVSYDCRESSLPFVLVNGGLQVVSRDVKAAPVWTSKHAASGSVEWWAATLACRVAPIYPANLIVSFQVMLLSGDVVDVQASPRDSLQSVLQQCALTTELMVSFDGSVRCLITKVQGRTLLNLGVHKSSLLVLTEDPGSFPVTVKSLVGKESKFRVSTYTTIEDFKAQIFKTQGIPPEQQCLIYAGKQLDEGLKTLADYGIESDSMLHLVLRLRGGMFLEVSSRDGFQAFTRMFPTVPVQVLLRNGAASTLSLQTGEFTSFSQMSDAVEARAAQMNSLLREQEETEESI